MVTLLCGNPTFLLWSSKTFPLSILVALAHPAFRKTGSLLPQDGNVCVCVARRDGGGWGAEGGGWCRGTS